MTDREPFDLEQFLLGLQYEPEERSRMRERAKEILAIAGQSPVRPKHVDLAMEAAGKRGEPTSVLVDTETVGKALVAYERVRERESQLAAAAAVAAAKAPEEPRRGWLAPVVGGVVLLCAGVGFGLWLAREKPAPKPGSAEAKTAAAEKARRDPDIETINEDNPGEALTLDRFIVRGKTTLFEYYSEHCQGSREMARVMDYLARAKADLAIRKVDIDRDGAAGIDFDSPLAEQHEIHVTPYFRIFGPDGRLLAEGDEAKGFVRNWYSEEQLAERIEKLPPEIRDRYRAQPKDGGK